LRYGAICKALHVLPRSGGVLDQDYEEIVCLEKILDAFSRYEDHLIKKRDTRNRNRDKHTEVRDILVEE